MPTKRAKRMRPLAAKITPAAVAAYKVGDWGRLHDALRLPPFHPSPLHVDGPRPPNNGTIYMELWPKAVGLREALEEMSNAE